MKKFNEHDTVIYTDAEGRLIDTFVIYEADPLTGLVHINHENLKVPEGALTMHSNTVPKYHLPMNDAFSFEIFKKLKEKYDEKANDAIRRELKVEPSYKEQLAQAS